MPEISCAIARLNAAALSDPRVAARVQRLGQPTVIAEVATGWDLAYLRDRLADCTVPVRAYGRDRYDLDKRQWRDIGRGRSPEWMPFAEFADLLVGGAARDRDLYLAKLPLQGLPLENDPLLARVKRLQWGTPAASGYNLYVGPAEHVTCLHYDPVDSLLLQLEGRKQVTLFPPSQLPGLYPFPVWVHLRHGLKLRASYSQVYPNRPDFADFPKLRAAIAHRIDLVLRPGEALYIPSGWCHEVTTLDAVTCSLNRFWHVHPLAPAAWSWNKWRIHVGTVLALPHALWGQVRDRSSHQWRRLSLRI